MKSYFVVFEGNVVGVGFRYTIQTLANQKHITGWIRNIDIFMVHAVFQCEYQDIQELIESACQKNRFIRIEEISYKLVDEIKHPDFRIIY